MSQQRVRVHKIQYQDNALVGFGGGGVYLCWQLGAARAIAEHRAGLQTTWTGASAGALCAAIMACGADGSLVMKESALIAQKRKLNARRAGLLGVWGSCTRECLEQVLPENAAEMCNGSLTIQLSVWRGWRRRWSVERVSHFEDRSSLIDAILASCHVPWIFDGHPFTYLLLEGEETPVKVCDGSIGWWIPARRLFGMRRRDLKLRGENGKKVDYHVTQMKDKAYVKRGPHFAAVLSHEDMKSMYERGYEFTNENFPGKRSHQLSFARL